MTTTGSNGESRDGSGALLEVRELRKYFPVRDVWSRRVGWLKALDDVAPVALATSECAPEVSCVVSETVNDPSDAEVAEPRVVEPSETVTCVSGGAPVPRMFGVVEIEDARGVLKEAAGKWPGDRRFADRLDRLPPESR